MIRSQCLLAMTKLDTILVLIHFPPPPTLPYVIYQNLVYQQGFDWNKPHKTFAFFSVNIVDKNQTFQNDRADSEKSEFEMCLVSIHLFSSLHFAVGTLPLLESNTI